MHPAPDNEFKLRILAWEITRRCNLRCLHCRVDTADPGTELTTAQAIQVMDDVVSIARPMLIWTGGEPMLRRDFYDLVEAARQRGFHQVAAPNGTLLDRSAARRMIAAGIEGISISLDSSRPPEHDKMRGVPGAFQEAVAGMEAARAEGLRFQVNTTVTASNRERLDELLDLAVKSGAWTFNLFALISVGRGVNLQDQTLSAQDQERVLNWVYDRQKTSPINIRVTCVPQFHRVQHQRARAEGAEVARKDRSRGCLAGRSFIFISSTGEVRPCGYLPISCGNVLEQPFSRIWQESEVLKCLRDDSQLKGKCGSCEYVRVCGGCRARAFARSGDYLSSEPMCAYVPARNNHG